MDDNIILKMDIQNVMKYLYSDALEEKDLQKLDVYINKLSAKELDIFYQLAKDFKHNKKYMGMNKYKITRSSIELSIKIYKDTGITTFPYISKIACKGFNMSGGTFAWEIHQLKKDTATICSNYRVSLCLQKKYKIDYEIDCDFEYITLKNKEVKQ